MREDNVEVEVDVYALTDADETEELEMSITVHVATDNATTSGEQMNQQNSSLYALFESEMNREFLESQFDIEEDTATAELEEIAAENDGDDEEATSESTGLTTDFLMAVSAALAFVVVVTVGCLAGVEEAQGRPAQERDDAVLQAQYGRLAAHAQVWRGHDRSLVSLKQRLRGGGGHGLRQRDDDAHSQLRGH